MPESVGFCNCKIHFGHSTSTVLWHMDTFDTDVVEASSGNEKSKCVRRWLEALQRSPVETASMIFDVA